MISTPSVWVLADDRPGNVTQCRGVADALGWGYEVKEIGYTAAAALPNFVLMKSFAGLTADSRANLNPPWPDVIIAAGRRTAPVARHIKSLSGGKTFLCQLMYPGDAGADEFDLIVVPKHDRMPEAPNRMQVIGAPHGVTAEKLTKAAVVFRSKFDGLPKPWIALIVGGTAKRRKFTPEMGAELGRIASKLAENVGGSLLVTTSRRTGDAAKSLIDAIEAPSFVFQWGDEGENPYFGYLSLADAVVVTGDSVSMACEACATEKPVYIYAPKGFVARKHAMLHQDLYDGGYARPLTERLEAWTHPPLNPAIEVAKAIRARLRK